MNDIERLKELKKAFTQNPNSLPLRNAIVFIENRLGLEPTLVPIDPMRFLDNLEASAPTGNEVKFQKIPGLTFLQKFEWLKRQFRIFLRSTFGHR